jgi:hypothetical protein
MSKKSISKVVVAVALGLLIAIMPLMMGGGKGSNGGE